MRPLRLPGLLALSCLVSACSLTPDRRPDRVLSPWTRDVWSPAPGAAGADPAEPAAVAAPPQVIGSIGDTYTLGKAGLFRPEGDIEALHDGFAAELTLGHVTLPFVAIEGSIGYLSTHGQNGPTRLDLWGLPVLGGVRVGVPFLIFEPYAGAGVGGVYSDYDVGSTHGSGWDPAWDAYVGLGLGLGKMAFGAELKYLQTGDTEHDFAIEGLTAFVFLALPF